MFNKKTFKFTSFLLVLLVTLNLSLSLDITTKGAVLSISNGQKAFAATYYYYERWNSVRTYQDTAPWVFSGTRTEYYNSYKVYQSGYSFDSTNNYYIRLGESWGITDFSSFYSADNMGTYAEYHEYYGRNYDNPPALYYRMYYKYASQNTYTDSKGSTKYASAEIHDETYPVNGRHTDGYWYVRGAPVNQPPTLSVISPSPNQVFYEGDTAYKPQISISDPNSDTLKCKYYIDSSTTPNDSKDVAGTTSLQTITFNVGTNMSTLSEGNHTIKCEVSDNKDAPVTSTVSIKVDKTPPTINGEPIVTSAINSITISAEGLASDSVSGLATNRYSYTVGSNISSWITNTSYTKDQLQPNTQYSVKFEARDVIAERIEPTGHTNSHIASKTSNIYTKAVSPDQLSVTNNAATPADALDLNITDGNPSGTEYQMLNKTDNKYVTPEGTPTASPVWVPLNNDASNIKKLTAKNLNPSTLYSFEVKARNGNGVETTSISASGTTKVHPPVAPTNLTAVAKNNSIQLNWEPLMDITGYDVLVDGTATVDNGTSTTFTHNGLNPGIQHKYKVRARNDGGAGDWSAELTKSTLPSKPDIPSNISAIASSNSVIVTWSPVSGATGYDVMVDGGKDNGGLEINGPSTNYVHTGLNPGTHHTYKVRSINPGGKSDWSSEVSSTTLVDIPLVPTNLHATASQNQVALTWDAVAGATYEVEADGNVVSNISSTTYTHTNLAPNTSHTYRVRSKKMGTTSDWSAALNVSTLNNVFGTPTNLKGEATDTSITLSWDAVTDATGYEVECDGVAVDNGNSTTCINNNLTPGTTYTYRVRAKNGDVTSDWSAPLPLSTHLVGTPKNLSTSATDTSITTVWEAVYGIAGYDIEMDGLTIGSTPDTTYTKDSLSPNSQHTFRVRAKDTQGNEGGWSTPITVSTLFNGASIPSNIASFSRNNTITVVWKPVEGATGYDLEVDGALVPDVNATKYIHGGLEPNTQHTYKVRAKTATETGQWSSLLTVSTLPITPQVPTNITSSSTTTSVTVSWDSVSNATGYEIEADGVLIDKGEGTSYLNTGLTPDSQHTYRVRAKNVSGTGDWSQPITVRTKSATSTYTTTCNAGDVFSLMVTASDVDDPSKYTYTVNYNPDELDVLDLCGTTPRIDSGTGNIMGSDITITQFTPGTIVFTKTGGVNQGQTWSGMVNSIKFKAKLPNIEPVITYSIQ